MNNESVTAIVPVYNEEDTVGEICRKLLALDYVGQVIVVDDCSGDRSAERVEEVDDARLLLVRREENGGKTAAIRTALPHITGDIVVIQDADLEYDPDEIRYLCRPIWNGLADAVYGSRFLVRNEHRVLYFYHYLGKQLITFVSNLFTNKNMTDVETCYKVLRTCLIREMPITSNGFGFEIEVTANISKTRARIYESPISYHGRTFEEGKKIKARDGLVALWYVFKYNIRRNGAIRQYVDKANAMLSSQRVKQGTGA